MEIQQKRTMPKTTKESAAATRKAAKRDAGIQSRWEDFLADLGSGGALASLVQSVLRESYLETNKDLRFFADKVRYFNDLKKQIRGELTQARKRRTVSTEPSEPYTTRVFAAFPCFDDQGNAAVEVTDGEAIATRGEFEDYIKDLEGQLSSVGDDAQLANVDLQNILQKQQQTLQTISNVSKMLHDTAMAVIRKIG